MECGRDGVKMSDKKEEKIEKDKRERRGKEGEKRK